MQRICSANLGRFGEVFRGGLPQLHMYAIVMLCPGQSATTCVGKLGANFWRSAAEHRHYEGQFLLQSSSRSCYLMP
jgi:hypothetical protein